MIHPKEILPSNENPEAFVENAAQEPFSSLDPSLSLDMLKEWEALQLEHTALKDRFLRTLADMENLRRRTDKEVHDAKVYSISNFARDVLTCADNLARALGSVPKEMLQAASTDVQNLVTGVDLIERDLLASMSRHGIRKIEAEGEKFDPHLHEALFEAPNPSVPAGTVVQVIEPGYMIGERVLRPAKVGVARGGPKMNGDDVDTK